MLKKNNNIQQKKFKFASLYDGSHLVTKFSLFYLVDLEILLDLRGEKFFTCAPSLAQAVPHYQRSGHTEIPLTCQTCHAPLVCVSVHALSSQGGCSRRRTFLSKHPPLLPPLLPKGHHMNCSPACTIDVFPFILYSKGDQFKYQRMISLKMA